MEDWDLLGRGIPCLVDLKPSGRFLMEEFFDAGGLPVVMRRIADRLNLAEGTVKNHVTNILTKLDVRDRTQAAIRARQLGIV